MRECVLDRVGAVYVDSELGNLRDGLVRVKVEESGSRAVFGEADGKGEREGRLVESLCDDLVSARQREYANAGKQANARHCRFNRDAVCGVVGIGVSNESDSAAFSLYGRLPVVHAADVWNDR